MMHYGLRLCPAEWVKRGTTPSLTSSLLTSRRCAPSGSSARRRRAAPGFIAAGGVLSGKMATVLKSPEEYAHRWAQASSQAVREALERPRNRAQYDWALGFAAENLRKLTRKANSQAIITLSAALQREAGLEGAERVLVLPLPEGGLLVRRATVEDLSEAHARYAATPLPHFPAAPAPEAMPEVERVCPECGLTFRTRQQRRLYCDVCKHRRNLKSARATWHRRGKLRLSYRRKLKGSRLVVPGRGHTRPLVMMKPV